jgi:carbon-monoxide dehydrogenase large subunit
MPMTPDTVWESLDEADLALDPSANVSFEFDDGLSEEPADD